MISLIMLMRVKVIILLEVMNSSTVNRNAPKLQALVLILIHTSHPVEKLIRPQT